MIFSVLNCAIASDLECPLKVIFRYTVLLSVSQKCSICNVPSQLQRSDVIREQLLTLSCSTGTTDCYMMLSATC